MPRLSDAPLYHTNAPHTAERLAGQNRRSAAVGDTSNDLVVLLSGCEHRHNSHPLTALGAIADLAWLHENIKRGVRVELHPAVRA